MTRLQTVRASLIMSLLIVDASCRSRVYDPNEELPALPGVSAKLTLVTDAAEIGEQSEDVLFVRETIHNDSQQRITVHRTPIFQANQISVRSVDGDVALTEHGRTVRSSQEKRDMGAASPIEAGETKSYVFPISRLFELTAPRQYEVHIKTRYSTGATYYATNPEPLTIDTR